MAEADGRQAGTSENDSAGASTHAQTDVQAENNASGGLWHNKDCTSVTLSQQ